jgi:zinc-ribbon domain
VANQASVPCPKCGQSNPDSVRFCTQCHFPLRFVCPACAHTQRAGGACEACGVEFAKYGMTQLSRLKLESERETARMKKQSAVFREVLLAVATGGFSLLKYLRPRR